MEKSLKRVVLKRSLYLLFSSSLFFFLPSFGAGRLKKGDMGFVCLMIFGSGVIMDRLLERRNGRM